ncbi:MAG: hypothetical protein U0931_39375 [Vulcanimicrobiota bacterium]
MRSPILRALVELGPVAAEFQDRLDPLHQEMDGRAAPEEMQLLENALHAIGSTSRASD